MHGLCAVLNSKESLEHMQDDLQRTDAIAEIIRGCAESNAARREEEEGDLLGVANVAVNKLKEKQCDVTAITIKEIQSILFAVYSVNMHVRV